MQRRSFFLGVGMLSALKAQPVPQSMLLDADTANEIDDLFAIARSLKEPTFLLKGLSSAQWHTRLSPTNTVELSQRINEDLLRIAGRQDLPAPMGAEMIMGKPWGGDEPRDSPAARLIIREALAASPSNRLIVASIGAATNLASALKMEPRIIPNVRCYLMAAHHDASTGIWNKDEFNVRNDLNAFNYLLNLDGLDLHVMSATVCRKLVFQRKTTMERLAKLGALGGLLSARWLSHAPEADSWIMWDLALVEALARPELAQESRHRTPPENKQREVWVYTDINSSEMERDFWRVLEHR